MKKLLGIIVSACLCMMLVSSASANPLDQLSELVGALTQGAGDTAKEGESGESPASAIEEPDGSGIPKDEPVSTTGSTYGYPGTFDVAQASSEQVNLTEGEWDINNAQMLFWGGSVIQNGGDSSLVVRNSYIRGETAAETAPLEGNPGNLLVAGNIRTTLGLGNSENIYLNSTVASRNWAALSTDAAKPALEEGQKELALYAYGSEAITMDGGYGAYSDLFCNLYSFGSHIQGAEIGIISGTYGKVVTGTVEDGEKNAVLASALRESDKSARSDKTLPSIIEGGRNAFMIHSVNLPPYWEYEGYSEEELPLRLTEVTSHGTEFRTDLSLDRGVAYEPQKQAYIDHTAGSVILIKSTNTDMVMDQCSITPDPKGTGYLIQSVYNNDTMFMNAVPDGETYPGIRIAMRDMKIAGDIAHEDYQRDMFLVLYATTLEGALNEYDFAHWKEVAAAEGFTDYCLDTEYLTHHGIDLTLREGTVWKVTEESHLSRLEIGSDCHVAGIIYVDGAEQPNKPGTIYQGKVVVLPGTVEEATEEQTTEEQTTEKETEPETETEHVHNWELYASTPAECAKNGQNIYICSTCAETKTEILPAKGHNYILNGSAPADCENPGYNKWLCLNCGGSYDEIIPALGHDFVFVDQYAVSCVSDGYNLYQCTRCGKTYTDGYYPATGHYWNHIVVSATCVTDGYEEYFCSNCGAVEGHTVIPATGVHTPPAMAYVSYDDVYHYYTCTVCGQYVAEPHTGFDPCYICGHTGPVG